MTRYTNATAVRQQLSYAGELHVRFDEGEQDGVSRQFYTGTKLETLDTNKSRPNNAEPVFYSTQANFPFSLSYCGTGGVF
jgi:hypothetical protein